MKIVTQKLDVVVLIVLVGLMYLWLIPAGIEPADDTWLAPQVMPLFCVVLVGLLAVLMLFLPMQRNEEASNINMRLLMYFGYLCVGAWLFEKLGFVSVAVIFVAGLMLMAGERRPHWLFFGSILVPLSIWLLASYVLQRPLM